MRLLRDFFSHDVLPTSEIYGLSGGFPLVRESRCRMGESFLVGESTVAVRLARPTSGERPLYWLIDDDLDGIVADHSVPPGYRQRLRDAISGSVASLQWDGVKAVIVPSARLARIYEGKGKAVIRINPSWPIPTERITTGSAAGDQVVFLGTGSHVGDLEVLRSTLESPGRRWHFNHYLGKHAPAWLKPLRRVHAQPALSWRRYRKSLSKMRFDLCVYPSLPTPVNEARSCNKIMEHAMLGVPALYSCCVPFAEQIKGISEDLLVGDDWSERIEFLLYSQPDRERLAIQSHRFALELANSARAEQAAVWRKIGRESSC